MLALLRTILRLALLWATTVLIVSFDVSEEGLAVAAVATLQEMPPTVPPTPVSIAGQTPQLRPLPRLHPPMAITLRQPTIMALHQPIMDRLIKGEMEHHNGNHKEAVGLAASSTQAAPVHCASLHNHWEARSSGSCQWRSLACSLSPGNANRVSRATSNNNLSYSGACGCSRWASSLALRASSTSTT